MLKVCILAVGQGIDASVPQSSSVLISTIHIFFCSLRTKVILSILRRQFEYISIYINLNNVQFLIKIVFCEFQEAESQDRTENRQWQK